MSVEFRFVPEVLPMAPRPMSDEWISSWLHRVATANTLSFGELLESVRGGHLPSLDRAMDHALPMAWRTRLATFCRIPESWISAIDLRSHFPNRNLIWFTHPRSFCGDPGEPSLQLSRPFCVHCGEEQKERHGRAYIRAEWPLAFRTHCPRHLSPLIDRCGSCGMITFPSWSAGRFCCQRCRATLQPTHTLLHSPGLSAVIRLQEIIHGGFLGRHPNLRWLGSVSGSEFLRVVFDLIDVLTHRTAQPGLVLADLLVPDEFRRAYNVGGRFQSPQFSALPWFARFLVLAALNQVLLAFPATPGHPPELVVAVERLLNRFFRCLPFEQKAGILKRSETWPAWLRMGFHQAATMVRQRPRRRYAVQWLGTTSGPGPRGSPPVKYTKFTF